MPDGQCTGCPLALRLEQANYIIVELQHIIREQQHEIENHQAAAAGWPLGTGEATG